MWKSVAAVSGMRYAAGKKADGNKYEIRNVPYSQSTVWHVFGTALACSKCLRSVYLRAATSQAQCGWSKAKASALRRWPSIKGL